jgi:hypothetical protein
MYCCYSRGSRYSRHSQPPSHYSYRSGQAPSEVSTVKTKTSRKGGLVVETMAAPNPFCPNTKGICCLMLLINLGLILVTIGFVVVIQFFEPLFVWYVSTFTALHTLINQLHGTRSSLSSQKFFSWLINFPYFFNIQININFSSMATFSRLSLSFTFFQGDH